MSLGLLNKSQLQKFDWYHCFMKNGILIVLAGVVVAIIAGVVLFVWPFGDKTQEVADIATITEEAETTPITETKPSTPMTEQKLDPLTEVKDIVARMRVLHSGDMSAAAEAEADTLQARYRELVKELDALEKDGVTAAVNTMAHGYDLVVTVNGKRINHFNGQNSASAWIYSPEHYMSELLMEDSKELIVLTPGENTIRIEYTQTIPNESFTLDVSSGYSDAENAVILDVAVSGKKGVIEKTLMLGATVPAPAKIVVKE